MTLEKEQMFEHKKVMINQQEMLPPIEKRYLIDMDTKKLQKLALIVVMKNQLRKLHFQIMEIHKNNLQEYLLKNNANSIHNNKSFISASIANVNVFALNVSSMVRVNII